MQTTAELIDRARKNLPKHGLAGSYYRLAKIAGVPDDRFAHYRKGRTVWPDEIALKIQPYLDYPPELILLWAHMERQKNPEVIKVLKRMEKLLSAA